VEGQRHQSDWISLVRERLGDDPDGVEQHVEAFLESPGWAFVSALIDDARAMELSKLTGRRVLTHEEFIAITRGVRALEMAQQVGGVVLDECARLREVAKRRVADEHAASGREEE
jgi:hypothetical protein